ncbi:MAG: 3-dehydroquinate synthase [Oscillospiraceae bacterium]|jgi:3-dehydroquinate synthase|nr:3-dehydroquinate synthase [Oscillospiraceae bacterium]
MTKITVNTQRPYSIIVGDGLLKQAGMFCRKVNKGNRALVITDSNVAPLYANIVTCALEQSGYKTGVFVFDAGEPSKQIETVIKIYDSLSRNGLTRGDLLIALGGGVTGDITGFAAATWLRGIDFVQIPTTLLAQVDSSVGGKTGVDIPQGKNLVGAFWQPVLVITDTDTLSSLPDDVFKAGLAEVIKTAAIKDKNLFSILENTNEFDNRQREHIIARCIDIKRGVVERDEHEKGERKLLNFGHTLGHALEKYYNYSGLSHGYAVSVGMSLITEASERCGLTEKGTVDRLVSLLKKFGLPTCDPASLKDYLQYTAVDKKRKGENIDVVLLKKIGRAYVKSIPINQLETFIVKRRGTDEHY